MWFAPTPYRLFGAQGIGPFAPMAPLRRQTRTRPPRRCSSKKATGGSRRPRHWDDEERNGGYIEMLELPARFLNGQYVGRRRGHHHHAGERGGLEGEEDEVDEEEEEEARFWLYESRSVDTTGLLAREEDGNHCVEYMRALKALVADGRLLMANKMLAKMEELVARGGEARDTAVGMLGQEEAMVAMLKSRVPELQQAIKDLDSDENWIFAQKMLGISTYFRKNPDGSLRIKLEGMIDGCHAFDMLAVLKEADMYRTWAPCCTGSRVVHEVTKTETVLWFQIAIPFILSRDCCMHVYVCDHTEEGSVLFVGGSVDEMEGVELPQPLVGWGSDRMEIKDFRAESKIVGTKTCGLKVICTVYPKAHLPQGLLNFCTKKIAGMLVYLLEKQAHKMNADPVNNPLAIRIRASPFYTTFLLPRVEDYTALQGWVMETLPSLQVPRDPNVKPVKRRRADRRAYEQQGRRRATATGGRRWDGGSGGHGAGGGLEGREGGDGGGEAGRRKRAWEAMKAVVVRVISTCGVAVGQLAALVVAVVVWMASLPVRLLVAYPLIALLVVGVSYLPALYCLAPEQIETASKHVSIMLMLQGVMATIVWDGSMADWLRGKAAGTGMLLPSSTNKQQ